MKQPGSIDLSVKLNMQNHSSHTQAARRRKYGLNVAVSVVAVLALFVLINWIAYRQFVRFDLTATRSYSLSPQTLKVLQGLEGSYQIVTLFSRSGEHVDQALDLIEEYRPPTNTSPTNPVKIGPKSGSPVISRTSTNTNKGLNKAI